MKAVARTVFTFVSSLTSTHNHTRIKLSSRILDFRIKVCREENRKNFHTERDQNLTLRRAHSHARNHILIQQIIPVITFIHALSETLFADFKKERKFFADSIEMVSSVLFIQNGDRIR